MTRAGTRNVFWSLVDGSGTEERLTTGEGNQWPASWSPDAQLLAISNADGSGFHVMLLRLADRKMQLLLNNTLTAEFSPNGQWLAYVSLESGRPEVYVQPYPGPGGKRQVSTDGGDQPVWNRNGRELFYVHGDKMMAVDVATQPGFSVGKPKMLFECPFSAESTFGFDVSPDGQRFLMIKPGEESAPTQINVVLNWTEELKRLVPTAK